MDTVRMCTCTPIPCVLRVDYERQTPLGCVNDLTYAGLGTAQGFILVFATTDYKSQPLRTSWPFRSGRRSVTLQVLHIGGLLCVRLAEMAI